MFDLTIDLMSCDKAAGMDGVSLKLIWKVYERLRESKEPGAEDLAAFHRAADELPIIQSRHHDADLFCARPDLDAARPDAGATHGAALWWLDRATAAEAGRIPR